MNGLESGAIALRTSGDQRPLFLIDDGSGVERHASSLAAHIDLRIPIYLLRPEALHGARLRTVEAISADMLRTIRQLQPQAGYRLLGWSSGEAVVREIATQLIGQDESVTFVGLLKPSEPTPGVIQSTPAFRDYLLRPLPIPVHVFTAAEGLVLTAELGRVLSEAMADGDRGAQKSRESEYRPCITIQTGQRAHTPIFCLAGAGDSVVAFTELAAALGDAWPLHGLQHRGLDGSLLPHSTVEAAAAMHVRAIDQVHPQGPVHLLGHSFGGWVALEIAHCLRANRRSVASLTLIDTEAPESDGVLAREYTATEALCKLIDVLELAAGKPLGLCVPEGESLDEAAQLLLLHQGCVRVGLMPRNSRPDALRGVLRVFSTALRTRYRPREMYPDPLRLLLVSDPRLDAEAERREQEGRVAAWRRWVPKVRDYVGAGNHLTVLKLPHVRLIAEWFRTESAFERNQESDGRGLQTTALFPGGDAALLSARAET